MEGDQRVGCSCLGLSFVSCNVSMDIKLYSTLSLSIKVYKIINTSELLANLNRKATCSWASL